MIYYEPAILFQTLFKFFGLILFHTVFGIPETAFKWEIATVLGQLNSKCLTIQKSFGPSSGFGSRFEEKSSDPDPSLWYRFINVNWPRRVLKENISNFRNLHEDYGIYWTNCIMNVQKALERAMHSRMAMRGVMMMAEPRVRDMPRKSTSSPSGVKHNELFSLLFG